MALQLLDVTQIREDTAKVLPAPKHKSINWEAPLGSHSQTEEPFLRSVYVSQRSGHFPAPLQFGPLDQAAWEHRNQPDFAHTHGCTHAHAVKHKCSHYRSSAPRPPALSSPAAITLSRHKKTVPKMNTTSTCTLARGNVRGNTSLVFFIQTPAFTMSLALGSGAHTVNQTA